MSSRILGRPSFRQCNVVALHEVKFYCDLAFRQLRYLEANRRKLKMQNHCFARLQKLPVFAFTLLKWLSDKIQLTRQVVMS